MLLPSLGISAFRIRRGQSLNGGYILALIILPEKDKVKPLERFAKMTSDLEGSKERPLLMTYAADRG